MQKSNNGNLKVILVLSIRTCFLKNCPSIQVLLLFDVLLN